MTDLPRALVAVTLTGLVALCAVATVSPAELAHHRSAAEPPPRVTVIGDSVATALEQDPGARRILADGVDLRLELAPCRRVDQDSCPYGDVRPPNVIQLVGSLGRALGPTVIVSVGYNDYEVEYEHNIENALAALSKAGVDRVLWTTLRAVRHPYVRMNDMIEAAAARHPELTVVDWNAYSRSHPDWFQPDELHLSGAGAEGMATLLHSALEQLDIPVKPPQPPPPAAPEPLQIATKSLPAAVSGRKYAARLTASGGRAPYRWSRGAPFAPWLRLTSGGRLTGTAPATPGRLAVAVRVTDAARSSATRRLIVQVRRS